MREFIVKALALRFLGSTRQFVRSAGGPYHVVSGLRWLRAGRISWLISVQASLLHRYATAPQEISKLINCSGHLCCRARGAADLCQPSRRLCAKQRETTEPPLMWQHVRCIQPG